MATDFLINGSSFDLRTVALTEFSVVQSELKRRLGRWLFHEQAPTFLLGRGALQKLAGVHSHTGLYLIERNESTFGCR